MFMLPASGCRPSVIKSCWPDAPDDSWFAYDANDPAPVTMRPTLAQMNGNRPVRAAPISGG